jgi:hypothetical protein
VAKEKNGRIYMATSRNVVAALNASTGEIGKHIKLLVITLAAIFFLVLGHVAEHYFTYLRQNGDNCWNSPLRNLD